VVVAATPERPWGGTMLAMEGDRWMVTLNGYLGQRPPTDPDGFVAFAAGLPAPDIFEVISDAEPLVEVLPARYPASVRRRYERLGRFPDGYLVTGNAVCAFNPSTGIEGARTAKVRLVNAYLARFHVAAATDPVLGRAFLRVVNLMDRPEGLLRPTIALRVAEATTSRITRSRTATRRSGPLTRR
jgi:hypothetical protein